MANAEDISKNVLCGLCLRVEKGASLYGTIPGRTQQQMDQYTKCGLAYCAAADEQWSSYTTAVKEGMVQKIKDDCDPYALGVLDQSTNTPARRPWNMLSVVANNPKKEKLGKWIEDNAPKLIQLDGSVTG